MAGINSAMKRVMENRNVGTVLAMGTLYDGLKCCCKEGESCHVCKPAKFIIIKLKSDGGFITQYNGLSDIHIAPELEVGDEIILMINDNWNATWQFLENKDTPNIDPRIFKQLKTLEK